MLDKRKSGTCSHNRHDSILLVSSAKETLRLPSVWSYSLQGRVAHGGGRSVMYKEPGQRTATPYFCFLSRGEKTHTKKGNYSVSSLSLFFSNKLQAAAMALLYFSSREMVASAFEFRRHMKQCEVKTGDKYLFAKGNQVSAFLHVPDALRQRVAPCRGLLY